jgi:ABC-type multidrug transport system ATPase subunit
MSDSDRSVLSLGLFADENFDASPAKMPRHRIVTGLLKKLYLIKVRRPAAIVEFIAGCIIWFILLPIRTFARISWPGDREPPLNFTSPIPNNLMKFFMATDNPILVVGPDCINTHEMVSGVLNVIASAQSEFARHNITIDMTVNPVFKNTVPEMETTIYSHLGNGIGIYWRNAEEDDARRSPALEVYTQLFAFPPDHDLLHILSTWLAGTLNDTDTDTVAINISMQVFATPSSQQLFWMQIALGFFAVIPIIFVTMPDMQSILDDKDSRVQTLTFLMGCSECAYWGVSFLVQFILSSIPYTVMSASFCYWFLMKGTSFTFCWVVSLLFIVSHIWFQMFVTTFAKRASQGRMITLVMLVMDAFFAYLHYFFTLSEDNQGQWTKHLFSIVPLSAYQLILATMYQQSQFSLPLVQWSDFGNHELVYPVSYAIFWLTFDAVVYFILFVLSNLMKSRDFGAPLLHWKEIFNGGAWRRLFRRGRKQLSSLPDQLIQVDHLSKIYNGERDVVALTDVSFSIYRGEVIVVIGPNGAGKSTLMNILSGAIQPTQGTLKLAGSPPTKRFADIQQYIGVCFQEDVLISLLSIREHFELFGRFRRMSDIEIVESLSFFSDTLQLTTMLDTLAGDLSGGQKRKLCIALSLLGHPQIVIMDEPTAGVDVQARQQIWKTICSLTGTTTIVTSHALEEAEAVSSRLFVIAGGRMPFAGTSTELRNASNCGYILRIEGNIENVLRLARQHVRTARMHQRGDAIEMPVCKEVPGFMREFEAMKDELGVISSSFAVEHMEDVILRLIQTGEITYDANRTH